MPIAQRSTRPICTVRGARPESALTGTVITLMTDNQAVDVAALAR